MQLCVHVCSNVHISVPFSICMSPCAYISPMYIQPCISRRVYILACVCPGVYLFVSQCVCPTVSVPTSCIRPRVYPPGIFLHVYLSSCVCPPVCLSSPYICPKLVYVRPCIYPSICMSHRVYVSSRVSHRVYISLLVHVHISLHVYVPTRPGGCMFRSPTECMSLPCVRPTGRVSPRCVCPGIPAYGCHHYLYVPLCIYPSVCVSRRVYVPSCVSHR